MPIENLVADVEEFNEACRVLYYTLMRHRTADGRLVHINLTDLEEALNEALAKYPNYQKPKEQNAPDSH